MAQGPIPCAHRHSWSCKVKLGQEWVPKAHCKLGVHRYQEYQTPWAPLVVGADKDSQKGTQRDNKAKVAQGHNEYRDQVVLVSWTLEVQVVARELGADWGLHGHLKEEEAKEVCLEGKAKEWALWKGWALQGTQTAR